MKKILALLLVAVMCLSFVACGKLDKNDTANYIGVWETENMQLTLNKGGVGEYKMKTSSGSYTIQWEVEDEVLITRISGMGLEYTGSLELNEDASSLTIIQNGFPTYANGETEFLKQP